MSTWIALLRGINVGGQRSLPMKELVALVEQATAARRVRSYIQSGNLVFDCDGDGGFDGDDSTRSPAALGAQIAAAVAARHGFAPEVLVLSRAELARAIADNPFADALDSPASLQLGFLAAPPPRPALDRLEALRKDSERFALRGQVFYLHAPEGVGRSRLAAGAEKLLGVPMTARNWNTVSALMALATR